MTGYIYRSHCKITGMYYIGCHLKDYVDTNYFGSGKRLISDLKKYGKENFEIEVLEWVHNLKDRTELYPREKYWCEKFNVGIDPKYYNISATGNAGNTMAGFTESERKEYSNKMREIGRGIAKGGRGMFGRGISLAGENNPMYGRKHTEESKTKNRLKHMGLKMSEETREKMRKSHNPSNIPPSHKGRKSVNKDGVVKRIYPCDIDLYISMGWSLGGLKKSGR